MFLLINPLKVSKVPAISRPEVSSYVVVRLRHVLAEGGGLKLCFGDENPKLNLMIDSPSSAHVRRFLLEWVASELSIFRLCCVLYHRVSGYLEELLSRGTGPQGLFFSSFFRVDGVRLLDVALLIT